jgi:hypothetical protein
MRKKNFARPSNGDIKRVAPIGRHSFARKASAWVTVGLVWHAIAIGQTPSNVPPPASPELQAKLDRNFARLQEIEARASRVDDVNELRNLQGM